ncbi:sugar transferase [Paracoccus everestensis]|uniref:sugar transferase n=1 Tax=Paracoccus everestensis TaxID=2903900 RepID=UPI0028F45D18|nr:sugar transferase [Paracoccus everestensis]
MPISGQTVAPLPWSRKSFGRLVLPWFPCFRRYATRQQRTSCCRAGIVTIHHDWDKGEAAYVPATSLTWLMHEARAAGIKPLPRRKRLFDVSLALLLLVPLSFIMAFVALVLLIVQGRPIFYAAPRMSSPNRTFMHLKFRTMMQQDGDFGVTGAHKNWRITPLGHFLRRTRIDEMPQLFNILSGDMSFVGPRPTIREYAERFPGVYGQVLRNRPGVTGLATLIYHQHEGSILARCRSAEETETAYQRRCLPTKLKIDLIYQKNRTMALDIWIMWQTLVVVFSKNRRPRRRK